MSVGCVALEEMFAAGSVTLDQVRRILERIFSIDRQPSNKFAANAFAGIRAHAGPVTAVRPEVPGLTQEIYTEVAECSLFLHRASESNFLLCVLDACTAPGGLHAGSWAFSG